MSTKKKDTTPVQMTQRDGVTMILEKKTKKASPDIQAKLEAGKAEIMKVVEGVPGSEKLAELIERGKKKGSLSSSELMDVLEDMDLESDQMDKIYDTLENLGIDTVGEDYIPDLPDDADPPLEAMEDISEEEIVDPNSMVDSFGTDDPVRMYLKEIGKVNLLSSDEEIELAQAMDAGNAAKEQLAELEEINRLCTGEAAVRDFWAHWEYNKQFHLKLMSFANNEFAYRSLAQALKTLTRAYAQFYWDQWGKISFPSDTKYHKDVIEAIRARDAEKAAHFLTADMQDFGRK